MANLSSYTVTIIPKEDELNVIPNAPIEIRERLANGTSERIDNDKYFLQNIFCCGASRSIGI